MDPMRINDWTLLTGASVQIRQQGQIFCSGYVDTVNADGTILWLQPPAQNRRLFEKAEFYEAWATGEDTGHLSNGVTIGAAAAPNDDSCADGQPDPMRSSRIRSSTS